ncbi:hypothetical protein PIROE2DRAFT_1090 [Piromyces sp. E2]|nr:hypothetical protein PIROE2DRAFT_1090 [Piromyces sp. E2]|eukprot:OUM70573.1 hypothetical protein PIROE2DRAFT_1090 [Piromyces sp. E2]
MISRIKILFILVIYVLLINTVFAKSINTLSNGGKVIKKNKNEDQFYLIYIKNTFGEFNIFSKPKNMKRQEIEANEYVFSVVDEIHALIVESKDTYKNPENNSNQQLFNYGDSEFIYPISATGDKVVLLGYLSKKIVEKVKKINGVTSVSQDSYYEAQEAGLHYYDEQEILMETKWKNLTVRENADFHLSLLSQGKYDRDELANDGYDTNYYYPSSAGEDIDIIIIDTSFNFNYFEFPRTHNRTLKCEAIIHNGKNEIRIEPGNDYDCGNQQIQHGQWVADSAGGLHHGTASRANIYGISLPSDTSFRFKVSDVIAGLQYVLENMIKPHKTIINISLSGLSDKISDNHKIQEDLINQITEKGGIVVAAAGNYNFEIDCTARLAYVPCYFNSTICVGGIDSRPEIGIKNVYKKAEYSNYGKEVDVYAPYFVYNENVSDNEIVGKRHEGTSFASPLTAGIIATIMSDHPEIEFTKDSMLEYLLEKAIPFTFDDEVQYIVNNGKHTVYAKNTTTPIHP